MNLIVSTANPIKIIRTELNESRGIKAEERGLETKINNIVKNRATKTNPENFRNCKNFKTVCK